MVDHILGPPTGEGADVALRPVQLVPHPLGRGDYRHRPLQPQPAHELPPFHPWPPSQRSSPPSV